MLAIHQNQTPLPKSNPTLKESPPKPFSNHPNPSIPSTPPTKPPQKTPFQPILNHHDPSTQTPPTSHTAPQSQTPNSPTTPNPHPTSHIPSIYNIPIPTSTILLIPLSFPLPSHPLPKIFPKNKPNQTKSKSNHLKKKNKMKSG